MASFDRFGVANHAAHAEQKSNRQNFGPPRYMTISPFIANPVVLGNMLREADTPIVVAVPPLYRSAWSACVATTSARSSNAYPVLFRYSGRVMTTRMIACRSPGAPTR